MYKIIGGDGKVYGPVSADTLCDWITSRRATADTQAQAEGGTEWKRLGDLPEFAGVFGNLPPAQGGAGAPPVVTGPVRTSGLATASLVLGVAGCLGITAVIGLVLGIVALLKIEKSQGRLGGRGLAIAGICVSAVMLVFGLPMLAGLMLPALAKAKDRAQTINCFSNVKELGATARTFVERNDGVLPQGTNWCDVLRPHVRAQNVFYCPREKSQLCGYGFNAALSGRTLSEVNPATVMFFEIPVGWNVSGGPEQMLSRPRHHRFINVVFVDGTARQVTQDGTGDLRWEP